MKLKITLAVLLLASISSVKAQTNAATPNAGFESWTHNSSGYDDATGWNDLNSSTNILGFYTCFKDSTPADVHSGKYSVQLITNKTFGQLVPGTITTGTINTSNQTISGGLPFTLRPDSIIGWYKYTPVSGDNADVEFYLFGSGGNSDTVGEAFFKTPTTTVSNYTRISYPITYRSSNAVASSLWIITSSVNQKSGVAGSTLVIDDIGLVFDTVTGINSIANPEAIKVGPNPANNYVVVNNISSSKNLNIVLFDITGRKVAEQPVKQGSNYIDISKLTNGLYIYNIYDQQNKAIKTGKIVAEK